MNETKKFFDLRINFYHLEKFDNLFNNERYVCMWGTHRPIIDYITV